VLSKAAEILGLVPVFTVRNTTTFGSGSTDSKQVFRDCVLVKKNTTVADVGRKVMGDAPIAYIEGVGGTRVADDQIVSVGKNDVSLRICGEGVVANFWEDIGVQGREIERPLHIRHCLLFSWALPELQACIVARVWNLQRNLQLAALGLAMKIKPGFDIS